MARKYDYDLYVIGAGSGGVRASRVAAQLGARVAVAESTHLGGTCVNVGCVPKKLFVYGSHFAEDFDDAAAYGWRAAPPSFDWPTLRDNKTREIKRLNGVYRNLLTAAGIDIHEGQARLGDPHRIEINGQSHTAERVLVATGGRPWMPEFPGAEHVICSDDAFYLPRFPRRVLVVGGGYIAVEFAGIFAGLGAESRLAYRGPLFLRGFDDGVREFVAEQLAEKGVALQFNTEVVKIELDGDERLVTLSDGSVLGTDLVMFATGRRPNVEGLGLAECGVALGSNGAVLVDEEYRSSAPHILAIGDVIDRVQLTPVAIEEAMCVAYGLFGNGEPRSLNYENIATAVFCQPNIGTVGLTEAQARQRFERIEVYESAFRPMKHTLTGRAERTFMKLIVDAASDRVIGVHMVGPEAGEIIQGMAVAVTAGATKRQFDATVGIHPTAAEEFVTMREARTCV
ncbi:MAG: glutathione-disulfide reductase [Gammaproteobacteria bacterium]|nr:glutathione-disulfide reductase [Gammaproteobacteria bacterium]